MRGAAVPLVALAAVVLAFALVAARERAPSQGEWDGPPVVVRDETGEQLGPIPGLKLMGDEPAPSAGALCDADRLERMSEAVVGVVSDGVLVDEAGWETTPWAGRAGLASFWSKCLHEGRALHVRARNDGAVLAVYDPDTGLTTP